MAICGTCSQTLPTAKRSWTMSIGVDIPSQNEIASNKGGGRFKYRAVRNLFYTDIRNALEIVRIPFASSKRRVLITRFYSGRCRDFDKGNLIGGCKPLMDSLVSHGLVFDDSPKWIEAHYFQERSHESSTRITIEEDYE